MKYSFLFFSKDKKFTLHELLPFLTQVKKLKVYSIGAIYLEEK